MPKIRKFPDWLYLPRSSAVQKGTPPTAVFRPALAVSSGKAWQSASRPRSAPLKKKILITQDTLNAYSPVRLCALVKFLENNEFEVYCFSSKEPLLLIKDLHLTNLLRDLSDFDPKTDYEICAKSGLSRDSLAVLDEDKTRDLIKHLRREDLFYCEGVQGSDFHLSLGAQVDWSFLKNPDFFEYLKHDKDKFYQLQAVAIRSMKSEVRIYFNPKIYGDFCLKWQAVHPDAAWNAEALIGLASWNSECCRLLMTKPEFFEQLSETMLGQIASKQEDFAEWLQGQPVLLERLRGTELAQVAEAQARFARWLRGTPDYLMKLNGHDFSRIARAQRDFATWLTGQSKILKQWDAFDLNMVAEANLDFARWLRGQPALWALLEKENLCDMLSARLDFEEQSRSITDSIDFPQWLEKRPDLLSRLRGHELSKIAVAHLDFAEWLIGQASLFNKLSESQLGDVVAAHASFAEFLREERSDLLEQLNGGALASLVKHCPSFETEAIKLAKKRHQLGFYLQARYPSEVDQERFLGERPKNLIDQPLPKYLNLWPNSIKPVLLDFESPFYLTLLLRDPESSGLIHLLSDLKGVRISRPVGREFINQAIERLRCYAPKLKWIEIFSEDSSEDSLLMFKILPGIQVFQHKNKFKALTGFKHRQALITGEFQEGFAAYSRSQREGSHAEAGLLYANTAKSAHSFTSASDDNGRGKYTMHPIGRGLNTHQHISVRTRILEHEPVLDKGEMLIKTVEKVAETYASCIPPRLSVEEVGVYAQEKGAWNYFQMNQRLPADGAWHRLYSIQPSESLVGILGNPAEPRTVEISRGEDDFYYAKNLGRSPLDLSYVLKLSKAQQSSLEALPFDHPARPVIEAYLKGAFFEFKADPRRLVTALALRGNLKTSFQVWAEEVYIKAEGVCWQRALSVAKVIESVCGAGLVRLVELNGNHVALELKLDTGQWMLLDVLGGGRSELNFQADKPASLQVPLPRAPRALKKAEESKVTVMLSNLAETKRVPSKPQLLEKINQGRNLLLLSTEPQKEARELIHDCRTSLSRQTFLIEKPQDIDIGKPALVLSPRKGADFQPEIDPRGGALLRFLAEAAVHPEQAFSMVILWDAAFTPQERLALNTLLDPSPSVMGFPLSPNIQIIGFCQEDPKDPSFRSRYQGAIYRCEAPSSRKASTLKPNLEELIEIDLEGSEHWQEKLLGRVILIDNEMVFKPGLLFEELPEDAVVKLVNIPGDQKEVIEAACELVMAQGYFLYHSHKVVIPDSVRLSVSAEPLSFSRFTVHQLRRDVRPEEAPALLVNTHWFDFLLQDKHLRKGLYQERPGVLASHPSSELSLYIAGDLTESQWYSLFSQAARYRVRLNLSLAPQVTLPLGLEIPKMLDSDAETKQEVPRESPVPAVDLGLPLIIDVEDYSFSDLFYSIHFEQSTTHFSHFEYQFGPVLQALIVGRSVILKGEFSEELLGYLAPLCVPGCQSLLINGEPVPFSGRLSLEPDPPQCESAVWYQEFDRSAENLGTPEEAAAFVEGRKANLFEALAEAPMARLDGSTGVGKSSLMRELEKSGTPVYRDLSALEAWALDKTPGPKILFIDECNIEDMHFTFLAPLLREPQPPTIFYQGKTYKLDAHHKVVFAGNDESYGGGRVKQNLFKHYAIPHLALKDFPPCYIYHRILAPIFELVPGLDPAQVTAFAQNLIQTQAGCVSVRQLQQLALNWCAEQVSPYVKRRDPSPQLYPAPYLIPAIDQLSQALHIKNLQKMGTLPGGGLGANGVLIEGKPGLGKTEMLRYCLQASGRSESDYVKIDASLSLTAESRAERTQLILDAFHRGAVIWIDELNSCCDDGLEKLLNSLLTGIDLDGSSAKIPGFMLMGTLNGADLEGRSVLSPALKDRCISCTVNLPTEDDVQQILAYYYPDLSPSFRALSAKEFIVSQSNNGLTLRELRAFLDQKMQTDLSRGSKEGLVLHHLSSVCSEEKLGAGRSP